MMQDYLLIKYIDGNCTEEECKEILRWMDQNPQHEKELFELKRMVVLKEHASYLDSEHISMSFSELQRLNRYGNRVRKETKRKLVSGMMRYAAVFIFLIGFAWGASYFINGWIYPEMIVVESGADKAVREVVLSDSTRVWLARNSKIEYPKRFHRNHRKVTVEGQAYFDVRKDANRPFYVETEAVAVRVKGTSFEVNTSSDKDLTGIVLETGVVDVLDKNRNLICSLTPGQQLEYRKSNKTYSLNKVDPASHTSWREGVLEFDGLNFSEIIKILEKYYQVRIVLGAGVDADQQFVGSLSYEKTILEMLKTMEYVTSVEYHVAIDTVVYIQPKQYKSTTKY